MAPPFFGSVGPLSAPRAPAGLGKAGRDLWRKTSAVYELSPAEARILAEACRTADELDRMRDELAQGSPLVKGSTGQPRANPMFDEVRKHRETLARLLTALGKGVLDA